MLSLEVGHFDKVVCAVDASAWIVFGTLLVVAVSSITWALKERDPSGVTAGLMIMIIILAAVTIGHAVAGDARDTDRARSEEQRDRGKARLYFDTHYPALKVLQFDTDNRAVRYERQNPRRLCEARLIPDGKVYLLGDDEVCSVPPSGG